MRAQSTWCSGRCTWVGKHDLYGVWQCCARCMFGTLGAVWYVPTLWINVLLASGTIDARFNTYYKLQHRRDLYILFNADEPPFMICIICSNSTGSYFSMCEECGRVYSAVWLIVTPQCSGDEIVYSLAMLRPWMNALCAGHNGHANILSKTCVGHAIIDMFNIYME